MLLLMLSVAVVLVTAGQIAALLSEGQPMADLHNSGERERERECQKKDQMVAQSYQRSRALVSNDAAAVAGVVAAILTVAYQGRQTDSRPTLQHRQLLESRG